MLRINEVPIHTDIYIASGSLFLFCFILFEFHIDKVTCMRALPWQCFPDSLLFSALDVWLTPTQSASFNQPTYQVCFVVAVEYKKRQYKQLPPINVYLYYKNVVYFVFPHNQTLYLLRSLYAQYIWMILYIIYALVTGVCLISGRVFLSYILCLRFPMTTFGVFVVLCSCLNLRRGFNSKTVWE